MRNSTSAFNRRWIGAGLLCGLAAILIAYYPAVRGGFYGDDWWLVPKPGMLSLPEYLAFYFDPGFQLYWYRPMHGVLLFIEYFFFRTNAEGYHLVQILLHAVNCVLLAANVWQISRRIRLAFLAGLFYIAFVPGTTAILYIIIHDPLAVTFYLTAIFFWILFRQTNQRHYYWLTIAASIAALLSKETSAVLIITLFLIDRLVLARAPTLGQFLSRNRILASVFAAYGLIVIKIQSQGWFIGREGYRFGQHVFDNLFNYARLLILPWESDSLGNVAWFSMILLLLIFVFRNRKSKLGSVCLFLFLHLGLTLAPVLAFPGNLFEARYLYLPSASVAVLFAMLFDEIFKRLEKIGWTRLLVVSACFGLIMLQLVNAFENASRVAEISRQGRVWLRDFRQEHPAFPPGTHIVFMNRCLQRHLAGMIFVLYGAEVSARCLDVEFGGVDPAGPRENEIVNLDQPKQTLVFYFFFFLRHEIVADAIVNGETFPQVPVDFSQSLSMEGFELTSNSVPRGKELALFLYWKARHGLEKDYTLFIHLLNDKNEMLAGADALLDPPTSLWYKDKLMISGHVLSIPTDAPVGDHYRLEIGLYYLPTLERVNIVDAAGQIVADQIVIAPFSVK